ncbi:hypothetical protein V6305_09260 [Serratia marcescens]|uniref:hypothetical protein n=1 Tax=Serratia marcescens TaxID=615 RepID=UPI0036F7D7C8
MSEPKIYSLDASFLPDADPKDGFCVDLVRVGDYASLKADRDAQQKRADALAVENAAMRNALESIRIYSSDTLSGPSDSVPDMAAWLRDGIEHLHQVSTIQTPATDAALAAIKAQAKAEAIEQLAIQLEQLPDEALEFLSDVAEFETYQEEHHTFVSISNPRAVANAVLSLVKEQSTDPREAK